MNNDERDQIIHDLRGHLGTIQLSVAMLETERDITATGQMSVKRIAHALHQLEQQLERLEEVTHVTGAAPDTHR